MNIRKNAIPEVMNPPDDATGVLPIKTNGIGPNPSRNPGKYQYMAYTGGGIISRENGAVTLTDHFSGYEISAGKL